MEILAYFVASVVATIIWGVRLEGKVHTQKELFHKHEETEKELLKVQLQSIDHRLARIERAMNGHLRDREHD